MDPRHALAEGVVAISDEVDADLLFEAYSFGIFPWPHNEYDPVLWFCPSRRGILDFSKFHVARSLEKFKRKNTWRITFDTAFDEVMVQCSLAKRPDQTGTWITPRMKSAYSQFHHLGYAHSVECWDGNQLVGGLYGVYVAGVFSAESMFYSEANASKLCVLALVEKLRGAGLTWLDIQMLTPHMKSMGGVEINRKAYLERLDQAKRFAAPISFGSEK
ncbi:MAG: leucyl/phenylalanyl-tRNA--protein transferase [Bdellovibrionaceae bacterium]|nr:leucyl/phenylalanyl-tRNA--protein transferase [Bdellovibrionales bacterium]MCB9085960.1 leucyl/phenylalanyl-tRNA--protein transferase [Pseudobdellovibrionaceae bacterium]